jgi:transketolase
VGERSTNRADGIAVQHVPADELRRIRELDANPVSRAAAFADACRLNVLSMVMRAGSGHLGTSFSCLDMLAWLHLEVLGAEDFSFSSKGHDAPALYAVLAGTDRIEFDLIHRLRRLGGLPGHPDVASMPEVRTSTGSLGMGVSKAKGFVRAARLSGTGGRVYVLTGDGELQEGQFWESLSSAAAEGMGEITAIVDHNKIQSDTWVDHVLPLRDVEAKARTFGWATGRCDGNDVGAFAAALRALDEAAPDRPKLIVADTRKGAGVSFMEPHDLPASPTALYAYHSGAPTPEEYERAFAEVRARLDERLAALGAEPVRLGSGRAECAPGPAAPQRLIAAYGEVLARLGAEEQRLVALDADLVLDTGLIPFRERFPERFVECGIAEQDMVSQAGALALSGLIPAVHSFACFLSTRPNEQIYNNTTEGRKVIYAGSLAGLVPGGPGHSHQSVRDISALGAMPGMALIEPYCEAQVAQALEWAVHEAPRPVYIRLVSVPWELGFEPPAAPFAPGRGTVLREGDDVTITASGPVMVSVAWATAEALAEHGVEAAVVEIPWLRDVDGVWLAGLVGDAPVVCLDNHYVSGGQGDAILAALADAGSPAAARVRRLGVESVPACGTNDEVLRVHRLDAASVADRVLEEVPGRV